MHDNSVVGYGAPALEQFGYKTKAGDSQKKMAAYTKPVLNQMAYGADLSATDFTGIGNSLRYAGATAHSANQSLAGTIGAVGVLSNNGQDGTVAGTGLRKDINSLMNTTSNGDKALKSIGLSSDDLRDSHNNLLSLDKAFELLNSHMKGMNDTERASVFHSLFGTTGARISPDSV
ncbi:phage tail tape measure protein [Levilactobacillus brevis]|uniref:phage tail tape measure protein n=1 Tax=Levilactobacillus brevis TaxID=1580 RepID=UPI0035A2C09A